MDRQEEYFSKDYYFGQINSNYKDYSRLDSDSYWSEPLGLLSKYSVGGKILDLGCAFGFFLKRVGVNFSEVYGLDISDYALKQARINNPKANLQKWNLNDNRDLPYPDNYFDVITGFDVVEHTDSLEKTLERISAKLKDGGSLLISLPIKNRLTSSLFTIFDKDRSHVSVPTKKQLLRVFTELGLEIQETHHYMHVPTKVYGMGWNIEVIAKIRK